jgi:hypothetical protein
MRFLIYCFCGFSLSEARFEAHFRVAKTMQGTLMKVFKPPLNFF